MKTTVYIGTSLDGFIAGNDGNIDWLVKFESEEIGQSYEEFISNIDAIVIGRGTFDKVLSFPSWPYDKKVFLLSTSLTKIPDALAGKVTLLALQPKELLSHLSSLGFSNIYIDGGKVIQGFLKDDCIDELIITTVPVLIGTGIPLFGYLETYVSFKHIQTRIFSNGLVKSHYERNRG